MVMPRRISDSGRTGDSAELLDGAERPCFRAALAIAACIGDRGVHFGDDGVR